MNPPDVAIDGGTWHTLDDGSGTLDFNLFQGTTDLVTGVGAGDGNGATGTIEVDDIRVYDTTFSPGTVWQITSCPTP